MMASMVIWLCLLRNKYTGNLAPNKAEDHRKGPVLLKTPNWVSVKNRYIHFQKFSAAIAFSL